MKKTEEYLKKLNPQSILWLKGLVSLDGKGSDFDKLIEAIKQAQKDTWNEAVKECADNADIKCLKKSQYGKYRKWQNVKEDEEVDLFSYHHQTLVDKNSILKLLKE